MASSSSDSKPENFETSRDPSSIEKWKNCTEEDEEIYRAAYSGDADKIIIAFSYIVDDKSYCMTEIILLLIDRVFRARPDSTLLISTTVRCLNQLIKREMQYHGPYILKDIIFFVSAIERPEKIHLISALLDIDCNIDTKDWQDQNLLHRLAHKDFSSRPYLQVAELLVKRGIDVNALNDDDETPLEHAIKNEHLEMVRLLLRNGSTKVFDNNQNIAHYALEKRSIPCLHAIIRFYLLKKIQGKEVDENIMNFITTEEISEHFHICLNALESLKHNIVNSNVSLYDILSKPKKYVVQYLRNEAVLSEIQRVIIEKSEFSYDLQEILDEALIRRDLEDSSLVALKKVFKLPELCLERIIFHLDNENLKNVSAL